MTLEDMIIHGVKEETKNKTKELLKEHDGLSIINTMIIPALDKVGHDFEINKVYLPQLIQSAEAAKLAFEVIKETFTNTSSDKGIVMICTVEGDIHDIGKNIVKVILESYGYQVIDLGKDVKVNDVVEGYKKYNPDAIGLSALMTTTVINMEKTIQALKDAGCDKPIWVGGAVLSEDVAKIIHADYYCKDAKWETVLITADMLTNHCLDNTAPTGWIPLMDIKTDKWKNIVLYAKDVDAVSIKYIIYHTSKC